MSLLSSHKLPTDPQLVIRAYESYPLHARILAMPWERTLGYSGILPFDSDILQNEFRNFMFGVLNELILIHYTAMESYI